MSLKNDVLRQLKNARGQAVSGQTLAETFSVSRAAVWKAVVSLKADGYLVAGATKTGYRLFPSDVPDAEEISALLNADARENPTAGGRKIGILLFDELPSTNAYAAMLAGKAENGGGKETTLVLAVRQTAGRARRGGHFPDDGKGLYMSLLFYPDLPPDRAQSCTEKICAAVHSIVGGERIENEIFYGGKKICGVLTEYSSDPDRLKSAIAGIGVYADLLPAGIKERYPDRNALCAALVRAVLSATSAG